MMMMMSYFGTWILGSIVVLLLLTTTTTTTTTQWSVHAAAATPWSSSTTMAFQSSSYISSRRTAATPSTSSSSWRPTSTTTTSLQMAGKIPILDDWKVMTNGRIMGTVKNHPTIPDGDIITTSQLQNTGEAQRSTVVTTLSGSRYKLGQAAVVTVVQQKAKRNGAAQPGGGSKQQSSQQEVSIIELQKQAKREKALTGDVVGLDGSSTTYLLAGRPTSSTSGKSNIWAAYKADADGLPEGAPVTVKLSNNYDALEREAANYKKITSGFTLAKGQFVNFISFLPSASDITPKLARQSAIILERGSVDLKKFIAMNGPLEKRELRDAASAAAQCLQAVHGANLVWTDLKTENFVVLDDGTIKGIDLESAMRVGDNPVDYSPEATPPEFAKAFLAGDGPYFVLDKAYDVWSYGMYLYELAAGKGYWDGRSPVSITKELREAPEIEISAEDVKDGNLRDLIKQCVQLNPKKRPNIVQILLHPYFLTSGLGPFSF